MNLQLEELEVLPGFPGLFSSNVLVDQKFLCVLYLYFAYVEMYLLL